jgi:hypothetical protein
VQVQQSRHRPVLFAGRHTQPQSTLSLCCLHSGRHYWYPTTGPFREHALVRIHQCASGPTSPRARTVPLVLSINQLSSHFQSEPRLSALTTSITTSHEPSSIGYPPSAPNWNSQTAGLNGTYYRCITSPIIWSAWKIGTQPGFRSQLVCASVETPSTCSLESCKGTSLPPSALLISTRPADVPRLVYLASSLLFVYRFSVRFQDPRVAPTRSGHYNPARQPYPSTALQVESLLRQVSICQIDSSFGH